MNRNRLFILLAVWILTKKSMANKTRHEASVGQFPYVALIEHCASPRDCRMCTGLIISEEWILTSNMCSNLLEAISVYVGEVSKNRLHLRALDRVFITLSKDISAVYGSEFVDFALIKIRNQYLGEPYVVKISTSVDNLENCTFVGFGPAEDGDFFDNPPHSRKLHYQEVNITRGEECPCLNTDLERKTAHCIKGGLPVCGGDYGGPVICNGEAVGIVVKSFDSDCDDIRYEQCTKIESDVVVILRFCSVLDWIRRRVPSVPETPEECKDERLIEHEEKEETTVEEEDEEEDITISTTRRTTTQETVETDKTTQTTTPKPTTTKRTDIDEDNDDDDEEEVPATIEFVISNGFAKTPQAMLLIIILTIHFIN